MKQISVIALIGLVLALGVAFAVGVLPVAAQSEGQIGGIVYVDKNGNGIREEGEEGLGGVEVVFDSGGWSTAIATAPNGAFSIALNPATWTVTVKPPQGYDAPKPTASAFIQNPGDAVTNLEFGLVPRAGGEVLPDSGGIVSSEVMIGGLVGILLIGVALVIVGQRRSRSNPS